MRRSIFIIMLLFIFTITSGVVFSQEKGGKKGEKARGGKGKRSTEPKRPYVGDIAPSFKLMSPDGKREVDLDKIKGEKPIALFIGSYT